MAREGWISLYRSIQDHWLWQEKPFSRGQAWIDLLLSANHKENKVLLGNELVLVNKGSFITSQKKLMNKWGWGNTKVRNFLKLLKEDNMIECFGKKYTLIKINNYKMYQKQTNVNSVISTDSKDMQTDSKSTTNRKQTDNKPQANTNNNDNNVNNDNNDNNSSATPNYIDFFNNNFHLISSYEVSILNSFIKDGLSEEVILLALKKAVERNVRNIKYVKSILQNWLDKNIKTVEAVKAEEKEFNRKKENKNKANNFNNYDQRNYDFQELERKLLGN